MAYQETSRLELMQAYIILTVDSLVDHLQGQIMR